MKDAKVWWVRFSLDFRGELLACGNRSGQVFLWHPHEARKEARHVLLRKPPSAKGTVRQTAVSYDGSTVLFSCDDGTIWRFDAPAVAAAVAATAAAAAAAAAGAGSAAASGAAAAGGRGGAAARGG